MLSEALHMQFVNKCIRVVMRAWISGPVEYRAIRLQHTQRRLACIRPFSHCQLAIKIRRKKHALRIGIEQNLLRIKAVDVAHRLARDRVSVINSLTKLSDW